MRKDHGEYRPAPAGASGTTAAFGPEVRPVTWGRPRPRSRLCAPSGGLHVTDEDRAAEPTDPDPQIDPLTGVTQHM